MTLHFTSYKILFFVAAQIDGCGHDIVLMFTIMVVDKT